MIYLTLLSINFPKCLNFSFVIDYVKLYESLKYIHGAPLAFAVFLKLENLKTSN